jgi:N-sulfoglucosamine sulfohydrolase
VPFVSSWFNFPTERRTVTIVIQLLVALSLTTAATAARAADASARRPNIVLFVADDHGQDAGCYGNTVIKTPNIDALAREGTLYRNAFCTTASCSPSRSVILSGLHSHLTGQYGLAHATHHQASFSSLQSLPVILGANGYRTARVGKFHVAPEEVYKFQQVLPGAGGNRNAVRMADNCKSFVGDASAPFFLYFCTSDPHRSAGVMQDNPGRPNAFGGEKPYDGMPETVYDPKDVIVPPFLPDTPECRAELAMYYQSVSRVDQGVGRLVQVLKDAGQWENTVFVYTSDNGIAMPGAKTGLYDAGMRLPLVVRTPGGGQVREAGAMVSWVDLTPTLLDFAGVTNVLAPPLVQGEPEERPNAKAAKAQKDVPYAFHGRSFRPTLREAHSEGWDEVYASHQFHEITMYYPMRVVRTRRYKLIYNIAHPLPFPFASDLYDSATWQGVLKTGGTTYGPRPMEQFIHRPKYELYDLQADPNEVRNLADDPAHAATFKELSAKLKSFQEKTRDPWALKYEHE